MASFNLQLELLSRLTTLSAEQLDPFPDTGGFIRYQVRSFNHRAVIHVHQESEALNFCEDEVFSADDVKVITAAIREYHDSRKLNFEQMHFDF
jgi:hypothetical protein